MVRRAVIAALALLPACATTTDTERAFQACRWEDGAERDRCIEQRLADARFDRHLNEVAWSAAGLKADRRQAGCMALGASEDDCRKVRDGPDAATPDPIDVPLQAPGPDLAERAAGGSTPGAEPR
ncbi:MAG: hypothetical protein AAF486_07695 [Pseudomonadota bacterium]